MKLKLSAVAISCLLATSTLLADMQDDLPSPENVEIVEFDICDYDFDGTVDEFEEEMCKEDGFNEENFADSLLPGEEDPCDFNKDGEVTNTELEQCGSDALPGSFEFEVPQNSKISGCLPGQKCKANIATFNQYFNSDDLPGATEEDEVILFTKKDVDKIVKLAIKEKIEAKLKECRKDPSSCGIDAFKPSEHANPIDVAKAIQNKDYPISGYYIHYGNGRFDWLYTNPSASFLFKLEGPNKDGGLDWTPIYIKGKQETLESIDIDIANNKIYFGALSGEGMPGE